MFGFPNRYFTQNRPRVPLTEHEWLVFIPFSGTARIVRADPGTENVKVEVLQKFFRANGQDSFFGEKIFMYGKSTANQVKRRFRSENRMHNAAFMLARRPSSTAQSLWKL